ncbi:MAG: RICIN domain-containing protein [Acidobacteriia bacterium]|nr:RICIN domain-containing protein [Terriglobia bacterium]
MDSDFGGTASRDLGIAACNGGASQKWEFQPNGHIVGSRGQCLAVKDGKAANGTLVMMDYADGNAAQTWRGWKR